IVANRAARRGLAAAGGGRRKRRGGSRSTAARKPPRLQWPRPVPSGHAMRGTTRLKPLIAAPAILVIPGVHDALGARIAEAAGFSAVTAGGYGATAALLGRPDSSQLSLTE